MAAPPTSARAPPPPPGCTFGARTQQLAQPREGAVFIVRERLTPRRHRRPARSRSRYHHRGSITQAWRTRNLRGVEDASSAVRRSVSSEVHRRPFPLALMPASAATLRSVSPLTVASSASKCRNAAMPRRRRSRRRSTRRHHRWRQSARTGRRSSAVPATVCSLRRALPASLYSTS